MMATKLTTYDPTDDLTVDVTVAAFMVEAFATGDAA
jgi:DNA-binding phage protein